MLELAKIAIERNITIGIVGIGIGLYSYVLSRIIRILKLTRIAIEFI